MSVAGQPSYTSLREQIASVSETDANTLSHQQQRGWLSRVEAARSLADTARDKAEISVANRCTIVNESRSRSASFDFPLSLSLYGLLLLFRTSAA